jgi:hypothetical protein
MCMHVDYNMSIHKVVAAVGEWVHLWVGGIVWVVKRKSLLTWPAMDTIWSGRQEENTQRRGRIGQKERRGVG